MEVSEVGVCQKWPMLFLDLGSAASSDQRPETMIVSKRQRNSNPQLLDLQRTTGSGMRPGAYPKERRARAISTTGPLVAPTAKYKGKLLLL